VAEALVIIDMQKALVSVVWEGDALAERLGALADRARAAGVPVIYLQQDGWPSSDHAPGSPGWELDPRVRADGYDIVVRKSATDGFFHTDLAERLAGLDVDTIIVTGIGTDFCVDATVRSALSHELDVRLVTDGHSTAERPGIAAADVIDHHNQILAIGEHPGGRVELVPSANVFAT
jgi:nicotinamidase-related amidase